MTGSPLLTPLRSCGRGRPYILRYLPLRLTLLRRVPVRSAGQVKYWSHSTPAWASALLEEEQASKVPVLYIPSRTHSRRSCSGDEARLR